jgi:hypothetical protein
MMGRPTTYCNHRGDTAQEFELLRDVTGYDGTPAIITVTIGATQRSGLDCFVM